MAPPSSFDAALHLDFDDWGRFEEYGADPVHTAASRFNESVSWDELTAASTGTTTGRGRRRAGT